MIRPSHCNVFTTLSEKQYPLFVIGAKYIFNSMPFQVEINKGKLESMKKILNRGLNEGSLFLYSYHPGVFLNGTGKTGFLLCF